MEQVYSKNNSKKRKLEVSKYNVEENNHLNPAKKFKGKNLLYLNKELADIFFVFQSNDDRIPAHKSILAALSPVFKIAFFGSMRGKDEVKIDDIGIDADAFKEFLQFFYLNKVNLSMEYIQSVMYLCHKYLITTSVKTCSAYLMKNLTNNEMCLGYQLAMFFDQDELKDFCKRKIELNAEEILKSEGFLNCDRQTLNEILKVGMFKCREIAVLEACINWAQYTCERNEENADDMKNIRSQLKDVIYNIHFAEITSSEFSGYYQYPYNDTELNDIFRIINGEKIVSSKFNCLSRFNNINRLKCQRCHNKSRSAYQIPNVVSTIFSSNKALIFGGFFVYMKPFKRTICCDISIERIDSEPKYIETFTEQVRTKPSMGKEITLPKRVFIEKNIKYKIRLDFSSNNVKLESMSKLKSNVKLKNDATITFHREESTDFNSVEKGVITWLYFNNISD